MRVIHILTGIFVIMLVGIITIVNVGLGPVFFSFVDEIPGGDKIGHFILIGILNLFVNLSLGLKTVTIKKQTILKGSLIVAILVSIEEISQLFLKHRGFEILDLVSDALGIYLFGRLAYYFHGRILRKPA